MFIMVLSRILAGVFKQTQELSRLAIGRVDFQYCLANLEIKVGNILKYPLIQFATRVFFQFIL